MSFGQGYINKFLFDFTDGWTVGLVREWAEANGYDISIVMPNLNAYVESQNRTALMLYTPIANTNPANLSGYFCLHSEAVDVYVPEGWDFVSSVPEEIVI